MRTALRRLAIGSLLLLLGGALAARTRPHYGGMLRVEVREMNWQDHDAVRSLVLDCLTATNSVGEAQPALATHWEAQNGERRWVFTLRGDVVWHDGTLFTAETAAAALQADTAGTILDGSTVRPSGDSIVIESTQAIANLPAELALMRFAIFRVQQGRLIGTGAFQLASVTGNRVVLSVNDAYWRGRPYLDGVEIATGKAIRDQWMDAGVNRTDVATVPAEMLRRARQERLRPVISGNTELIALVATRSGLALDARLRQALASSIDRAALLNFAFQKQGEVSPALLPNWLTGYAALFSSAPEGAHARELREQAGQPSALAIGYEPGDATLQLVAERIALTARDYGLQVTAGTNGEPDFLVARIMVPSINPQVALAELAALVGGPIPGAEDIEETYRGEHELCMQSNLIPLLYVPRAYALAERIGGATLDGEGRLELSGAWIEEPR